jgi:hypothetical protein
MRYERFMADTQMIANRMTQPSPRRRFGPAGAVRMAVPGPVPGRIFAPLLGLIVTLSGCAGQRVQMGSTAKTVPAEQALVMPPPAGPGIVSVVERRFDNAIDQDIHLSTSAMTPGQNMLKVQMFGTVAPFRMSSNTLTSTPVTASGIGSEMRKALPGVAMARSQFYVQNSYGPFGYAFGRGAGSDLCIYGWQQVRSPTGTISPFANYGSIQIRLRVCEAGASEQKLLAIMYNYTILGAVDAGGWNPYGEPNGTPPALGGIGAPSYPRPASTEPMVSVLPQRQSIMTTRTPMTTSAISVQRRPAPVSTPVSSAVTESPVPEPAISANAGPAATPSPVPGIVVPSPSGSLAASAAASRVTVPSPSCTTQKEGTDIVCQ